MAIVIRDPEWKKARGLLASLRRRAKRQGGGPVWVKIDAIHEMIHVDVCCLYCHLPIPLDDICLDHKQPISRGGCNDLHNLALCCSRCNEIKGKMNHDEFRELLGMLARWHPIGADDIQRRLRAGGVIYARGKRRVV